MSNPSGYRRCGTTRAPRGAFPVPVVAPQGFRFASCAPLEFTLGGPAVTLSGADVAQHAGLPVPSKRSPFAARGEFAGVLVQAPAWSTAETTGASFPQYTTLRGWRWHAVRLTYWDTLRLHSHRVGVAILRPYFVEADSLPLPDEVEGFTLDELPPLVFPMGRDS